MSHLQSLWTYFRKVPPLAFHLSLAKAFINGIVSGVRSLSGRVWADADFCAYLQGHFQSLDFFRLSTGISLGLFRKWGLDFARRDGLSRLALEGRMAGLALATLGLCPRGPRSTCPQSVLVPGARVLFCPQPSSTGELPRPGFREGAVAGMTDKAFDSWTKEKNHACLDHSCCQVRVTWSSV